MSHIYSEQAQSATCFVDCSTGYAHWFRFNPCHLFWCRYCGRNIQAKYTRVQVYYDDIYFFCMAGHGCQNEKRGEK